MGRFLIDLGMIYYVESPLFKDHAGKLYYPSDPIDPQTGFPVGLDPTKHFYRWKGLGSLSKSDIYDAFYNPLTRRLIRVTPEDIDYGMSLVENINQRKKLLFDKGIITNPYGWTDL